MLLVLTSACASLKSGWGRLFGGGGEVGGSGVILKFIKAPAEGQEVKEGNEVRFLIGVENYVTSEPGLVGELCLLDRKISRSPADGIRDAGDCKQVDLPPATIIDKEITPSKQNFPFGPYIYMDIEKEFEYDVPIYANLKYEVQTVAGANTCVKKEAAEGPEIPANCGEKQDLTVQQIDLPLKISKLTTEASPSDFTAKVYADIILTKVKEGQVVTKSDIFSGQVSLGTADIDFTVEIGGQTATCPNVGDRLQLRQDEDKKLVQCYAEIPLNQNSIDVPIRIKMGYGFIQTIQGPTIKLVKGVS